MARPKKSAPEPVQDQPAPEHGQVALVLMAKDGEEIEVHPTCVAAHQRAGWKVVS